MLPTAGSTVGTSQNSKFDVTFTITTPVLGVFSLTTVPHNVQGSQALWYLNGPNSFFYSQSGPPLPSTGILLTPGTYHWQVDAQRIDVSLSLTVNALPYTIDWSTIDCGGGDTSGGTFTLSGTIGQPDAAAPITGGTFQITGGYWPGATIPCYANCDGSTAAPVLNANDFNCFVNAFAAGQSYANCDGSTAAPVLNANDFNCFLNKFAAGCP